MCCGACEQHGFLRRSSTSRSSRSARGGGADRDRVGGRRSSRARASGRSGGARCTQSSRRSQRRGRRSPRAARGRRRRAAHRDAALALRRRSADIDFVGSLLNACRRGEGGRDPRARTTSRSSRPSTSRRARRCSCIDVCHSMILYGEDRITPAKHVALALTELILTRYPKDALDVVAFGDDALEIAIRDIPYVEVGPYHTNTKAGAPAGAQDPRAAEGDEQADLHDHRRQAVGDSRERRPPLQEHVRPRPQDRQQRRSTRRSCAGASGSRSPRSW